MGATPPRKKIVIDTDPGIGNFSFNNFPDVTLMHECLLYFFYFLFADDALAICVALNSPEIEVVGLTTIFGNVYTTLATRNALHLVRYLRDSSES